MLANLENHDVDTNVPALAQLARGIVKDIVVPVHQPRRMLTSHGGIDIAREIPRDRHKIAANEFIGPPAIELNRVISNAHRANVRSAAVL